MYRAIVIQHAYQVPVNHTGTHAHTHTHTHTHARTHTHTNIDMLAQTVAKIRRDTEPEIAREVKKYDNVCKLLLYKYTRVVCVCV